ncbi:MAG TPA: LacI family DNA-binding transcriptional regulator [Armatimonadota bacterium]|nr:LacI family DNA-binding transcriptional regulator [Armatimonadota bacterium]
MALPTTLTAALPIASFLSPCQGTRLKFCAPDEVATGRLAVEYLVSHGHQRILHITYSRRSHPIQARQQGYQCAMEAYGLSPQVCASANPCDFLPVVQQYNPTAIFCHNDWLALSVIRELNKLNRAVPNEISVLGVDNSPTFTALYPDITTMQYPYQSAAAHAISWILQCTTPPSIPSLSIIPGATVRRI